MILKEAMYPIQTDLSEATLIKTTRLNLCELFRYVSKSHPEEHFENERFSRWHTPLAFPWFNGVLCSSAPQEGDEAFVRATIEYFRQRNVTVFTWWIEPQVEAAEWESLLTDYGFGFSNSSRGMAIDLQAMSEPQQPVEGLEIRTVEDEKTMRVWAHVFVNGYGLPPDWEGAWLEVWKKMGLDFPMRNYIGYLNGEPVSTSSVFLGAGVAGIYSVATMPQARGKGIGAAVTVKPLQEAHAMGYRIGILQSSEMGFPVYKRLGFKDLGPVENFYLRLAS
ncbi:MAG: GNAT family N-acetyltransferase [Chloroflexota bacterium]|nr:GNAT family N-acetyltransferase [Chloroflexota bacterium]